MVWWKTIYLKMFLVNLHEILRTNVSRYKEHVEIFIAKKQLWKMLSSRKVNVMLFCTRHIWTNDILLSIRIKSVKRWEMGQTFLKNTCWHVKHSIGKFKQLFFSYNHMPSYPLINISTRIKHFSTHISSFIVVSLLGFVFCADLQIAHRWISFFYITCQISGFYIHIILVEKDQHLQ